MSRGIGNCDTSVFRLGVYDRRRRQRSQVFRDRTAEERSVLRLTFHDFDQDPSDGLRDAIFHE